MSAVSTTVLDLVRSTKITKDYFSRHAATEQEYSALALQLITNAIQHKNASQQEPSKHHVAYVKHRPFLSPKQKADVTPKVTQITFHSPERHVIYGKPKAKIEQGNNCVIHDENRCEEPPSNYKHFEMIPQERSHVMEEEVTSYLLPKNRIESTIHKPVKAAQIRFPSSPTEKGSKNFSKHQSCRERYDKIQSRIKYLIDEDKRTRKLETKMEEQTRQLQKIEQRQMKMRKMELGQTKKNCSKERSGQRNQKMKRLSLLALSKGQKRFHDEEYLRQLADEVSDCSGCDECGASESEDSHDT